MRIIGLMITMLVCKCALFSQRVVEVKYEKDGKGNYQFYGNNHGFCQYILEINFTRFDNVKGDLPLPFRAMLKPGINKLFKLTPIDRNLPVQFKYGAAYIKGCINPVVLQEFTYILPIAPGKETQAYELQNTDKPREGSLKDWYVIRLKMKPGDTIYATRRGVVAEVETADSLNDTGLQNNGNENYVEIVHGDCSFGHYGILRRNSALVKPGQRIEAGKPIGLVGGDRFGRGSEIRFSVYYNHEGGDSSKAKTAGREVFTVYVPLQFWTKKHGKGKLQHGAMYVSEHPPSLLNQELPKPAPKKKKKTSK